MQNPFDQFVPQQGGPVVIGTPRPRLPSAQTPVQALTDEENLQRVRLANQGTARDLAAGPQAAAAEAERKAASFLIRAIGSNQDYENTGVGPRSLPGQMGQDLAPDISYANSDDPRQASISAQDEFIAASLRQDSGAAIPAEEMLSQRRIYFPRPGAGPMAINQARRARQRAIAGLLNSAGRSATPAMRAAAERYLQAFDRRNEAVAAQIRDRGAPPMAAPVNRALDALSGATRTGRTTSGVRWRRVP